MTLSILVKMKVSSKFLKSQTIISKHHIVKSFSVAYENLIIFFDCVLLLCVNLRKYVCFIGRKSSLMTYVFHLVVGYETCDEPVATDSCTG